MGTNPLKQLQTHGQSVWLDYIRRDLIVSGQLRRFIQEDGLVGITSNPSIFEKAILESHEYDAEIHSLAREGKDAKAIYETISQKDVQMAADEFRPVYEAMVGNDGFVSLEVNPHLAHDTQGTIDEARRLWDALDRPNVCIKIPATVEGLPAIKQLIAEGININITLLFGLPRYSLAADAYIEGIEERIGRGYDVSHVASVASFFISRIDTAIDPLLQKRIDRSADDKNYAKQALGNVAIASAKMAYQIYKEKFNTTRFNTLKEQGAYPQRVLWASTGTKNPEYSDVKYIETLIGPDTVNTVPLETLNAFRDHGIVKNSLEEDREKAVLVLETVSKLGINIEALTQQLEEEGVEKFIKPFDNLMETLTKKVNAYSMSNT